MVKDDDLVRQMRTKAMNENYGYKGGWCTVSWLNSYSWDHQIGIAKLFEARAAIFSLKSKTKEQALVPWTALLQLLLLLSPQDSCPRVLQTTYMKWRKENCFWRGIFCLHFYPPQSQGKYLGRVMVVRM